MGSKRTTYYADDVEKVVDIDPENAAESFSGRVGFLITSAAKMAEEHCPALPIGVWLALADANNGSLASYDHGAPWVVSGAFHNLYDSDTSQFGIDGREWALKLRDLPFSQQFAVFEVVRRFWTCGDDESPDYQTRFRKIGANVSE